jgi:hypothetical protein
MSRPTQRADLTFGLQSESDNLELLQQFLQTTLKRTDDAYCVYDFESDDKSVMVELKSRRIRHDQYDTVFIGWNKIVFCERMTREGVKFHLAFAFSDGLYTIQYDPELFADFEVRHGFQRSAREDASNAPSSICLIPTKYLKKVEPRPTVTVAPPALVDDGDEKECPPPEEEPYFYA